MITINGHRVGIEEGTTVEFREIKNKETLEFIRRIVEHCNGMGSDSLRAEYGRGFRDAVKKCEERLKIMTANLKTLTCGGG